MRPNRFLLSQMCLVFFIALSTNLLAAAGKDTPRKCIMVFGSHADDVEEIAGGTLAKYVAEGYQGIYVCVMNNTAGCLIEKAPGDKGGPNFSVSNSPYTYPVDALETHQIREVEARNGAAALDATPVFLNFVEPEIWLGRKLTVFGTKEFMMFNAPGRRQVSLATRYSEDIDFVVDLLKKYQPEIIIIHTLGGEKLDHGNSAYLMYLAYQKAISRGIAVGKLWMKVDGWLLDELAQSNGRGNPDVHIDVKNYLKTKYEALDKHVSQNGGSGRKYVIRNQAQPKEVIEEFITVGDNTR
jgi:LmbE family N-acetylglucosaminyl deacetylase